MSRLLSILMAGSAVLAFGGTALAQQEEGRSPGTTTTEQQQQYPSPTQGRPDQEEADAGRPIGPEGSPVQSPENQATEEQAGQTESQAGGTQAEQGGHPGQHDEEYAEAIRKCESMAGTERDACIKKAGKKPGDM